MMGMDGAWKPAQEWWPLCCHRRLATKQASGVMETSQWFAHPPGTLIAVSDQKRERGKRWIVGLSFSHSLIQEIWTWKLRLCTLVPTLLLILNSLSLGQFFKDDITSLGPNSCKH